MLGWRLSLRFVSVFKPVSCAAGESLVCFVILPEADSANLELSRLSSPCFCLLSLRSLRGRTVDNRRMRTPSL